MPDEAYFPGPSFWRSDDVVGHPPVDTSGIIQPPVHAVAAARLMAIWATGAGLRASDLPVPGGPERLSAPVPDRPGERTGVRRPSLGDRHGQLTGLGFPVGGGAGRPGRLRHPHPPRPRSRRRRRAPDRRGLRPLHPAGRGLPRSRLRRSAGSAADAEFVVRRSRVQRAVGLVGVGVWPISRVRSGPTPAGIVPRRSGSRRRWSTSSIWPTPGGGLFHASDQRTDRRMPERTVGGLLPLVLPGLPATTVEEVWQR